MPHLSASQGAGSPVYWKYDSNIFNGKLLVYMGFHEGLMEFNGISWNSMEFMRIYDGIPSGKRLQFAIENCPVEIVHLPMNSLAIFHSSAGLPEDMENDWKSMGNDGKLWEMDGLLLGSCITGGRGFCP